MAEEAPSSETLFCTVHPSTETNLRCNKCGRPMCIKCARRTPVGYRCKECVRGQLQVFYNAQPLDWMIQAAVSFVLSIVGAAIVSLIGSGMIWIMWFAGLAVASGAGALIADVTHRAVGKRRGPYSWLVVAAGIVLGAIAVALIPTLFYAGLLAQAVAYGDPEMVGDEGLLGLRFMGLMGFANIGWWIYVVFATAGAVGRLRLGK